MNRIALIAALGLLVSLSSHGALTQDQDLPRYVFTYKLNNSMSYMAYQYQVTKQDIEDKLEDDIQEQLIGALAEQLIAANPPQAGDTSGKKVQPEQL